MSLLASRFERAGRFHEPRKHGRDQLQRIRNRLSGFARKYLGVRKQLAMHGYGEFERQFHRLVVGDGAELELCHLMSSPFVGFEYEVTIDDHADRKARPNRERWL